MLPPLGAAFLASWPMSGGDTKRTGAVGPDVPLPLSVAWSRPVDGFLAGGIVADSGVVVYADGGPLPPFTIHAVDLQTGTEVWVHEPPPVAVGTPCIAGGRVLAGNAAAAFCLDLESGERLWYASPVGGPAIGRGPRGDANCALCVGRCVVFCDNGLAILDAETGRAVINRTFPLEPSAHTGPCATDDILFLPFSANEIARLNPVAGRYERPIRAEGKVVSGPIIAEDLLVYGTNRRTLCAVDLRSLEARWTHTWTGDEWFVESRPAYADRRLFVGGPDGALYCFEAASGQVIWQTDRSTEGILSPPIVVGSSVFILVPEGEFKAYGVSDGRLVWRSGSTGGFGGASCAPAVADGFILVGWDCIYAFRGA